MRSKYFFSQHLFPDHRPLRRTLVRPVFMASENNLLI